ncbi:DNA-methyltransferase [Rhodococcoides fascians]|uniref:DNA-methyltransferase n=1 Tax=Rhodococcoides fascians TaxID=1828 RepID=UPI00055F0199|nr:DNA methyltransferase [Rhodococcus fascians]
MSAPYITDTAAGTNWTLMLGDSCERISEIGTDTVDLSICSPPFDSLYTYSPSVRDLGNSATRTEFLDHYRFIVAEQLRITKPGRNAAIHVQQVATKKAVDGFIGLTDFRGDVIRLFQEVGWIFYGEVTVWKDPQAQSIRTKAHALAFATKNRDSSKSRPAMADYLLLFKKPGDNAVPVRNTPVDGEVTNDDWIDWASPIWSDHHDGGWIDGDGICPVWHGVKETNTLNTKVAKEQGDERHIAPLQLDFIDRCVRLWSNPGELVFTPFAGIGSELYQSVKRGRRAVGIELKPSYWRTAVDNLTGLESELALPSLFDQDA